MTRPAAEWWKHQREKAHRFGFLRKEEKQQAGQPDRLGAEIGPEQAGALGRRVPLVEDQVENHLHGGEALGKRGAGGNLVRNPCLLDLPLGADQALRQRRFGDEERSRDLSGLEPSDSAQRQGDPALDRKRRVAAGEDQAEAVVGKRVAGLGGLVGLCRDELRDLRGFLGPGLSPGARGR